MAYTNTVAKNQETSMWNLNAQIEYVLSSSSYQELDPKEQEEAIILEQPHEIIEETEVHEGEESNFENN